MNDSGTVSLPLDETTTESQDKALAVVQRLLKTRGVRAQYHQTISMALFANRPDVLYRPHKPPLQQWLTWHPPELVVRDASGRRAVTVTMGAHADCYMICLHMPPTSQTVSRQRAEKVVELILSAAPMMQGTRPDAPPVPPPLPKRLSRPPSLGPACGLRPPDLPGATTANVPAPDDIRVNTCGSDGISTAPSTPHSSALTTRSRVFFPTT